MNKPNGIARCWQVFNSNLDSPVNGAIAMNTTDHSQAPPVLSERELLLLLRENTVRMINQASRQLADTNAILEGKKQIEAQ